MSETENTGATDTGSADNSGSTASTDNQGAMSIKDRAFASMAKEENISDWLAEERDRKAESEGDEKVETPLRKQERLERIQRALDRAREAGEPASGDIADEPHSDPQADRDAEIKIARADAQFELRANEYIKANPDFVQTVQEVFSVIPPNEVFRDAVRESPFGPELVHMFAQNPDAIEEFNALSPAKALRIIGAIEGRIAHEKAAKGHVPTAQRKATKAPAPMQQLRGGASPTKSVAQMAKSEDATELLSHWAKERKMKAAR